MIATTIDFMVYMYLYIYHRYYRYFRSSWLLFFFLPHVLRAPKDPHLVRSPGGWMQSLSDESVILSVMLSPEGEKQSACVCMYNKYTIYMYIYIHIQSYIYKSKSIT